MLNDKLKVTDELDLTKLSEPDDRNDAPPRTWASRTTTEGGPARR